MKLVKRYKIHGKYDGGVSPDLLKRNVAVKDKRAGRRQAEVL